MMGFLVLCLLAFGGIGVQGLFTNDRCNGRCYGANDFSKSCQCNTDCETLNNCCFDFWTRCRGSEIGQKVSMENLTAFAQTLWESDVNRIDSRLFSLNYQGQTTAAAIDDQAVNDLIVASDQSLDAMLASKPTYSTFIKLLDNYEENFADHEQKPQIEIDEENDFWNAISQTTVVQKTFEFLRDKGFIKNDIRALWLVFQEMWFELYPQHSFADRSGFEHVVIGEKKTHTNFVGNISATVVGFRNWVRYYDLQKKMKIDYKGYIAHTENPTIADIRFTWDIAVAKSNTFFFGTSPEFDLCLFTVCALTKPNRSCNLSINGKAFNIHTRDRRNHQILQISGASITYPVVVPTTAPTTR